MSAYSIGDVWKAIFTRLTADATLATMVSTRIYDNVPQGTAYPYIANIDPSMVDNDTKDQDGADNTITLHVWSRYDGTKEVDAVLDRLYALLHRAPLGTVGSSKNFMLRVMFAGTVRHDDTYTRHGVIRLRALTVV